MLYSVRMRRAVFASEAQRQLLAILANQSLQEAWEKVAKASIMKMFLGDTNRSTFVWQLGQILEPFVGEIPFKVG